MAVNLKIVSQVVASGTPGPAGKSAYQIAVDNGFEGTESEWLKVLHPFKGWFDSVSELEEEHSAPSVGEYAYVKGATPSDPVKIYECSTEGSWSDSGRTVDTSTVQTFGSGEAVNDVNITDDSSDIEENNDKIPTAGAVADALGNAEFSTGEKVKNVGIDAAPTAGSDNLVKSGGVTRLVNRIQPYLTISEEASVETYIPVSIKSGHTYTLLKTSNFSHNANMYVYARVNKNSIGQLSIAIGSTQASKDFTADKDYNYLYFLNNPATFGGTEEFYFFDKDELLQKLINSSSTFKTGEKVSALSLVNNNLSNTGNLTTEGAVLKDISIISNSTNIFVNDGFLASNGSLQPNDSYITTDFLRINKSFDITIKGAYNGGSTYLICFYNQNKDVPCLLALGNGNGNLKVSSTDIPQDAQYFRMCTHKDYISSFCVNNISLYALTLELLESKEMISKSDDKINTLYDSEVAIKNIEFSLSGYYAFNGTYIDTENASRTELIDISRYHSLLLSLYLANTAPIALFYNEDKEILTELTIAGNNDIRSAYIDFTKAPYLNVRYVALSNYNINAKNFNGKATLYPKDVTVKTIINIGTEQVKSIPLSFYGYWMINGAITSTINAMNTGLVCRGNYRYLQYETVIGATAAAVLFYDANLNLLSSLTIDGTHHVGIVDFEEAQYKTAMYFTIAYYDASAKYIRYQCHLSNEKPLNILIFGDSITDCASLGIDSNKRTSTYQLRFLSGSYVRDGVTIQYSFWPALLTKQFSCYDIRNYAMSGASYKDVERTTGNERQNLSYQIDVALNDLSNPNGVFPTDGNFEPDIIIFALGTNDGTPVDNYGSAMAKSIMNQSGTAIDIEATLSNLDRTLSCDAARYAFLKIRDVFPTTLILCVLPIQRADREQVEVGINTELSKLAKRYGILVIDGASDTGIIRDLEVWQGVGVNLKDGLHPTDTGQNLLASLIANKIKANYDRIR